MPTVEAGVYQQIIIAIAMVVVVLAVLVFFEYSIRSEISASQNNISRLNQRLVQLNKEVKEINEFKKMKGQIQSKLDVITRLEKNRMAEVHLMDEMSKSIPIDKTSVLSKKLWLVSLKQNSGLIGIDGIALDNSTIAKFMDNLSHDPYFSNVNLTKTEQVKSKDLLLYKFSLTCKFIATPGSGMTQTTSSGRTR